MCAQCRAASTQLQSLQTVSSAAAEKLRAAQEENRDLSARLAVADAANAKLKVSTPDVICEPVIPTPIVGIHICSHDELLLY